YRLALSEPVPFRRARRQQQLTRFLTSEPDSPQAVSAEPCAKSPALCSRSSFVSHPPLRPLDSAIPRHPDHTFRSSDELSRLGKEFKLWLKRRRLTKEQLGRIQEMDETELLSTLPVVFAKDLSACVPISKTQRIILLFDSHEAFWGVEQRIYFPEERRQEFDDWFRALLKTLNRSRGIVVVVAGRDEPLHWPNAFDRWKIGKVEVDLQQVEGLSVEDSRDYLLRVGITDALLCDTLLQYAQLTPGSVHPLFLHLCTEVIRNASAEGVHLTPSDFQQSVALVEKRVQLVRSLFKYLYV